MGPKCSLMSLAKPKWTQGSCSCQAYCPKHRAPAGCKETSSHVFICTFGAVAFVSSSALLIACMADCTCHITAAEPYRCMVLDRAELPNQYRCMALRRAQLCSDISHQASVCDTPLCGLGVIAGADHALTACTMHQCIGRCAFSGRATGPWVGYLFNHVSAGLRASSRLSVQAHLNAVPEPVLKLCMLKVLSARFPPFSPCGEQWWRTMLHSRTGSSNNLMFGWHRHACESAMHSRKQQHQVGPMRGCSCMSQSVRLTQLLSHLHI